MNAQQKNKDKSLKVGFETSILDLIFTPGADGHLLREPFPEVLHHPRDLAASHQTADRHS